MDIEKMSETLSLFEGTHDFTAFAMNKSARIAKLMIDEESGEKVEVPQKPDHFLRTVDKISVEKVDSPVNSRFQPIYNVFDFYTAEFTAQGFFQNQVSTYMYTVNQRREGKNCPPPQL